MLAYTAKNAASPSGLPRIASNALNQPFSA